MVITEDSSTNLLPYTGLGRSNYSPPAHQNLVHTVLRSQSHGCDRSINAPFKQSALHQRADYFLPVNRSHIELNMLGGCGFMSFMLSRRFFAPSVKCSCSVANMGFRSSLRRPSKDRLRPSVLLLAAVSALSVPSPDDIANVRWISLTVMAGWRSAAEVEEELKESKRSRCT